MVKRSAKTLTVSKEMRLDGFLRAELDLSWGRARGLAETGKVFVDGTRVLDSAASLGVGQTVEVIENAPRPLSRSLAQMPEDLIVFADAHVVVVRKPAGISTVPYDETETGTTLDELVKKKLGVRSLGVVHRIDKETTGLVVFTRTWLAKKSLSSQFRAHTVARRYLALAHGDVPKKKIVSHLLGDRGDGLRGSARVREREGQIAITHVEPIEKLVDGDAHVTLVSCTLETGRTHQIRIHLSELGHPILGERVYVRNFRGALLAAPRVMLHAAELGFVHPKTERLVKWEEKPPADFRAVRERMRAQ